MDEIEKAADQLLSPERATRWMVRIIVRFTEGSHAAIINPADNLAVTVEMQTQTVTFAVSNGTLLPITNSAIVQ